MSRQWISENEFYSRSAAKIQRSDLHSVGKKHCFIETVNTVPICKIGCYCHISLLILKHLKFLDICLLRIVWTGCVYVFLRKKLVWEVTRWNGQTRKWRKSVRWSGRRCGRGSWTCSSKGRLRGWSGLTNRRNYSR